MEHAGARENATPAGRCATVEAAPAVRPREIYQTEIANALADAIVDYKGSVGIAPHEWLTVAARESVLDRRFVPGDPNDTAITVILRIKGSDLQALREGTLAREDEARRQARSTVKQATSPAEAGLRTLVSIRI